MLEETELTRGLVGQYDSAAEQNPNASMPDMPKKAGNQEARPG
ncbi:hypothetical protein VH569_03300 [Azospirillum sp. 11R-A]